MKRLLLTLAVLLGLSTVASAQLLYKISKNGLDKPSYIVGTLHVAPASFANEISGMQEVVEAVEQVYGEVDMQSMNAAQMANLEAMMLTDGRYIDELFSEEEMARINAYLRQIMMVDLTNPYMREQLGRMRPSILATQLTVLQYMREHPDVNPTSLIDNHFQQAALRAGKPTGGLETIEFQMELLYAPKSIEEEREELLEVVDNNAELLAEMEAMAEVYFAQDIDALHAIMLSELESGDMSEEEWSSFIDERNHRWCEIMPAIMAERPTLFVVGAGHLSGENGVLELLRRAGYKIKAVR